MQTAREQWDIYDANRLPTGRIATRGERLGEEEYHIIVHVCVFHPEDGRLLIQQRQPFKKGWSNLWDVTAGGSALAGETSAEAAERELAEEVGVHLPLSAARPTLTIHYEDGFDDYYLTEAAPEPEHLVLQEEEVQAVRWADLDEVLALIREGRFIPLKESFVRLLFALHEEPTIFHRP